MSSRIEKRVGGYAPCSIFGPLPAFPDFVSEWGKKTPADLAFRELTRQPLTAAQMRNALPDDWESTKPADLVDEIKRAAERHGVPIQMFARQLCQEGKFNEPDKLRTPLRIDSEKGDVPIGYAQMTRDTLQTLKNRAILRGDTKRSRELATFSQAKTRRRRTAMSFNCRTMGIHGIGSPGRASLQDRVAINSCIDMSGTLFRIFNVSIRLSGAALVALFLAIVAGASAQARGLPDFLEGYGGYRTAAGANDAVLADLAAYYRMYANVRLGREYRLGNGVAWRLLTDIRTGAAAPRITWMADRTSLLKANALFDAVHGEALVEYEVLDLERRYAELYEWRDGRPSDFVIKPPYFYPERVALTYATSRLVSYVEVRREVRMISMGIAVYGRVLDLEQGRISEIEGCGSQQYTDGNFRFGQLLDVCDDAAYRSFMALWKDKVSQAIAKAKVSRDELSEQCGESMGALDMDSRRMALYLTPAGLAVFNNYWIPNSARVCAFHNITVNPIIFPYRELEPFVKLGPWLEELLK